MENLLLNVHKALTRNYKATESWDTVVVNGDYQYYHYGCDGVVDQGWGCGYRSLQTIASYIVLNHKSEVSTSVPSIADIQQTLVSIHDKPSQFIGSKEWIGSFEICLCLDQLYGIPCKIIYINNGNDLAEKTKLIYDHFVTIGSPIMMGGNVDAAAKTIVGLDLNRKNERLSKLLIVDPHFSGKSNLESLYQNEWVKWRTVDSFLSESFYNLCLPQCK